MSSKFAKKVSETAAESKKATFLAVGHYFEVQFGRPDSSPLLEVRPLWHVPRGQFAKLLAKKYCSLE